MRGGTTSLYNYLIKHPQVVEPAFKEPVYWTRNRPFGDNWYKKHLGDGEGWHIDASVMYFCAPNIPELLAKKFPNGKGIIMLRNPINRLWSHFNKENIIAPLQASASAISTQTPEYFHNQVVAYIMGKQNNITLGVQMGQYIEFLDRWTESWRDRLMLVHSEAMFKAPDKIYQQILEFLGIEQFSLQHYERFFATSKGKMLPETRELLEAYYAPYNELLQANYHIVL